MFDEEQRSTLGDALEAALMHAALQRPLCGVIDVNLCGVIDVNQLIFRCVDISRKFPDIWCSPTGTAF